MDKKYLIGGGVLALGAVVLLLRGGSSQAPADAGQNPASNFFIPTSATAYTPDGSTNFDNINTGGIGSSDYYTAMTQAAGDDSNKMWDTLLSISQGQNDVQLHQIAADAQVSNNSLNSSLLESVIGKLQKNQGATIEYDANGNITNVSNVQQTTTQTSAQATKTALQLYKQLLALYNKQLKANQTATKKGQPLPYPNITPPVMPSAMAPLGSSTVTHAASDYQYNTTTGAVN